MLQESLFIGRFKQAEIYSQKIPSRKYRRTVWNCKNALLLKQCKKVFTFIILNLMLMLMLDVQKKLKLKSSCANFKKTERNDSLCKLRVDSPKRDCKLSECRQRSKINFHQPKPILCAFSLAISFLSPSYISLSPHPPLSHSLSLSLYLSI